VTRHARSSRPMRAFSTGGGLLVSLNVGTLQGSMPLAWMAPSQACGVVSLARGGAVQQQPRPLVLEAEGVTPLQPIVLEGGCGESTHSSGAIGDDDRRLPVAGLATQPVRTGSWYRLQGGVRRW
jgi:hypothetical protein